MSSFKYISIQDDQIYVQPNLNTKPIRVMLKLFGHVMEVGKGGDLEKAKADARVFLQRLIKEVEEL